MQLNQWCILQGTLCIFRGILFGFLKILTLAFHLENSLSLLSAQNPKITACLQGLLETCHIHLFYNSIKPLLVNKMLPALECLYN